MIMRHLLKYLLEYDSNEDVMIETPSGALSDKIQCCVRRDDEGNIVGVTIKGEE